MIQNLCVIIYGFYLLVFGLLGYALMADPTHPIATALRAWLLPKKPGMHHLGWILALNALEFLACLYALQWFTLSFMVIIEGLLWTWAFMFVLPEQQDWFACDQQFRPQLTKPLSYCEFLDRLFGLHIPMAAE